MVASRSPDLRPMINALSLMVLSVLIAAKLDGALTTASWFAVLAPAYTACGVRAYLLVVCLARLHFYSINENVSSLEQKHMTVWVFNELMTLCCWLPFFVLLGCFLEDVGGVLLQYTFIPVWIYAAYMGIALLAAKDPEY